MPSPTNEILNPLSLVVPKMTTAVRNTLASEVGAVIYDTTLNKLCFKNDAAVSSDSWEVVTSVEES